RNQDSDHDVDLERAHQQPAPARGSDLGDIHRPQPRRAPNAESADETEDQQRRPAPREGAAESGNDVAACQNAQALAPAELVAHDAREHGPDDRPQERDRYGEAQLFRAQAENQAELLRGAGYDSGVEAEEQAAKRADCDALHQQGIEFGVHACWSLFAIRFSQNSSRNSHSGYSLQTASSLPFGSAKWNRLPPGNSKISRTILPPVVEAGVTWPPILEFPTENLVVEALGRRNVGCRKFDVVHTEVLLLLAHSMSLLAKFEEWRLAQGAEEVAGMGHL